MACRYYFNVVKANETIIDPEGAELDSLEQARAEAIEDARSLMSMAVLDGFDISDQHIEICNEAGEVLMSLPFRDTLKPRT